ncbi:MAG: AAA family ATPase, partial [Cyclobacteriaceae bacterium]
MIPKIIKRALLPVLRKKAFGGKALIILGPRQTGKTTLLRSFVSELNKEFLWLNCDDPAVRPNLENVSLNRLKAFLKGFEVVVIDEAQRVKNIGITMKLITDEIKSVQLLV